MASPKPSSAAPASKLGPSTKQTLAPPQSTPAQHTSVPSGLLDLEKELTCCICTDILYQPLTLLDCLHTFCGSCLKEWFAWQAAAARQKRRQGGRSSSSTRALYTCPQCRAGVRDTRPNATVTTLLDMYLQVNPTRRKSEQEKKSIAEHFKPGESVLPPPPSPSPAAVGGRRREEDDEEDRRLMDEVRQMSLRELERSGTRTSRGEGGRRREERNRRRDELIGSNTSTTRERSTNSVPRRDRADRSPQPPAREQDSTRSLEHQSSLRSLISSSDLESQEMEEEIMRQILEEGLLDGIDLSNIDRSEEEEVSERIAQAYRRRQRERALEGDSGGNRENTERMSDDTRRNIASPPPSSYQPVSTTAATGSRSNQRSSSQGSSSSARLNQHIRTGSEDAPRAASGSSTDISNRIGATATGERQHRRVISHDRRRTASEAGESSFRSRTIAHTSSMPTSTAVVASNADTASRASTRQVALPDSAVANLTDSTNNASPTAVVSAHESPSQTIPRLGADEANTTQATSAPFRYCSSCTRPRIQHEIHYTCSKCAPTTGSNVFALCQRCYRLGKGCNHWFGFGEAAWTRFRQQVPDYSQAEPPHVLDAERYVKTASSQVKDAIASYHEVGMFCDACSENANACFWRCNVCNEGEWGFCNKCVNQAKHCTHPLLPLAWEKQEIADDSTSEGRGTLTPLPVHTTCNVCNNPIPPSNTRFHCPRCNDGDYDICISCYHTSVSLDKISPQNGPQGWRKCEKGHRMLLVGFESRPEGQRRIVLESVIGGWQMSDEEARDLTNDLSSRNDRDGNGHGEHLHWTWRDTSTGGWRHMKRQYASSSPEPTSTATGFGSTQRSLLPPPGGAGFRTTAMWTRVPDEGVEDELLFPRWAEITEVLTINEDWCWGIYCKKGGLFPEGYGRPNR